MTTRTRTSPPLLKTFATVGQALKPGDLVIDDSTDYPGCIKEDCAPVREKASGLMMTRPNISFELYGEPVQVPAACPYSLEQTRDPDFFPGRKPCQRLSRPVKFRRLPARRRWR
jgi:hypothetical protein